MGSLQTRIKESQTGTWSTTPPFPKKRMLVELSNICNHQCIFCANSKMTRKKGFMEETFLLQILQEAYDLGMREVGFYATGEPLVVKDLDRYIYKAKKIGYEYVYLTTNGALASREKVEKIIDAGLDSIKFSINAGTKTSYKLVHGKDDFDTVLQNLKYVDLYRKKENTKMKLYASCIVNKINQTEKEILSDLIGNIVDELIFINVMNMGGMMYEINEVLTVENNENDVKSSCPCPLLFNSINITYEGYLTACCTDFQNYLVVANLNEMDLKTAWNSQAFKNLRKMHIEKNVEGTLCYNCIYNKNKNIEPVIAKYATKYNTQLFEKTNEIKQKMNDM